MRDAKSHILATYEEKSNGSNLSYRIKEHDIYGSSRLGTVIDSIQLIGAMSDTINYNRVLGQKEFELANHLGNVITVVSDKKIAQDPIAPLSLYNSPNLVRTTIDSLGGMKMQPLQQNGGMNFVFKSIIGQAYQVDFYVDLGNTNSGDALSFSYPSSTGNSLATTGHYTYNFTATDTLSNIMPYYGATGSTPNHYFLFDSLKIVATGTTLDTIRTYNTQIVNISDYYPFGAIMDGREYAVAGQYRYGFNGKEKDDETFGEGDEYDYGMRIYDSRLGRFMSIDPLTAKYPWWTPYQFAGNMPIRAIDLDGKEILIPFDLPLEFPIEPIITIPRSGTIPLSPEFVPVPPIVGPVPEEVTSGQPQAAPKDNAEETDWSKVDRKDTKTWPKPPPQFQGKKLTEGDPSRAKPTQRGEKSWYDEEGGELRPHLPDDQHPEGHWDYKPPGKNTEWQDISTNGERMINLVPVQIEAKKPNIFQKLWKGVKDIFKSEPKKAKPDPRLYV